MNMDFDSDFSDSDYEENSLLDYNYIFVDIQGFKTYRNRFICKEISVIDNDFIFHTLIKSPYDFNKIPAYYKRQAFWLTNFLHGLNYESGDINIIAVKEKLYKRLQERKIAVKSSEKIKWLKFMFHDCCVIDCVNFDDLDYDHIVDQKYIPHRICDFHNDINLIHPECALKNTLSMQSISFQSRRKIFQMRKKINE